MASLRSGGLVVLASLMVSSCLRTVSEAPLQLPKEMMRGVCYAHTYRGDGYGSEGSHRQLVELSQLGADWISITPFGFVPSAAEGEVLHVDALMARAEAKASFEKNQASPETDDLVRAEIRKHKALGLKTQLKPHLWMLDNSWRGKIARDDAGWKQFFASYRGWILHYAEMAEREGVQMLVVGVELDQTVERFEETWRALIAEVRERFSGTLTYAANWDAYTRVPFWDAVDYVGVQFYPPLAQSPEDSESEMKLRLARALDGLDRVYLATKKTVLLTEVGYRAVAGTAVSPHTWPDPNARTVDEAAQAQAYRVLFAGLRGRASVGGVFLWKWYTDPAGDEGPAGFAPRGYAAEKLWAKAFGGAVPSR